VSQPAQAAMRIHVDPTNPGQFFACCGLLEVADRLGDGAYGWFEGDCFLIATAGRAVSLRDLLTAVRAIQLLEDGLDSSQGEEEDEDLEAEAKPLAITLPFRLQLDWWKDKSLKTWAGSMNARQIFVAMCNAIDPNHPDPLNQGQVVFDPQDSGPESTNQKKQLKKPKKREPFYLDARRGASAKSIDVGFAPDALKGLTTTAYPVVEALCLIGLQRCRPIPTGTPRVFDYCTWSIPLEACVIPAAVSGLLTPTETRWFRFANAFRTDQRKHKAFTPATPIARS